MHLFTLVPGIVVAGVDLFDQSLFRLSPNEAAATDPQHRLLLEETLAAWSQATAALQLANSTSAQPVGDAGIGAGVASTTGVYVGSMYDEYADVVVACSPVLPSAAVVGSGPAFMVGRLSYTFGFSGGQGRAGAAAFEVDTRE